MIKKILSLGAIFCIALLIPEITWANSQAAVDEIGEATSLPIGNIENELIPTAIRFILSLFAMLITSVAVYAGYLMVANFGDEEEITKAKKLIIWSMVGIGITAASYAIVAGIINLDFSQ